MEPATSLGGRLLDVVFGVGLLGGGMLVAAGLHRSSEDRYRSRRSFSIGSAPGADAPVDPAYLAAPESAAHELVTTSGEDFVVHPTPRMNGVIEVSGQSHTLDEIGATNGTAFRLPPGARVRLECGRTMFVIRSIGRPAAMPRSRRGASAAELPYAIGAAAALGLFVLMIFTIPPDPRSLSLDRLGAESRLLSFRIAPPADPSVPLTRVIGTSAPSASAPAGPHGASGGAQTPDRYWRRDQAKRSRPARGLTEEESIRQAGNAGVIGILKADRGESVDAIFERGSALGEPSDVDAVFGHLEGTVVGSAWGKGGLDVFGTGDGGAGTGEGILGVGSLQTLGRGRGRGRDDGPGYGRIAGRLGTRRAGTPDVIPCEGSVRGALDKEIVRRSIRRHLNEIRFCYEEGLRRRPQLDGRVAVQFTIAGTGRVLTSLLQSSTLGDRTVENCAVNAVRRWEFPQPQGGGLVMVSYPFAFTRL